MACGELEFLRALQHALGHVILMGLLIDPAQFGEKGGVAQCCFVSGRRHSLHVADGQSILAQLMMGADEAHPGRNVRGIRSDNLRVKRGRLRKTFGVHQNAGILHFCIEFEGAAVIGKRQRQRQSKNALGIGGTALRLVDGGQRAEDLRIFVERRADAGREALRDSKSLVILTGLRAGEEQTAPAVERGGLEVEKLLDRRPAAARYCCCLM